MTPAWRERGRVEGREARSFEDISSEIDCGTAIVHGYITAELKLGMNLSLLLSPLCPRQPLNASKPHGNEAAQTEHVQRDAAHFYGVRWDGMQPGNRSRRHFLVSLLSAARCLMGLVKAPLHTVNKAPNSF